MKEILILCLLATISMGSMIIYFYKRYMIDAYRQKIFSIRDSVFDYAADGNIAFDNTAYCMVRTYLNGMIRFTEQIGFFQFLLIATFRKASNSQFESAMSAELNKLSEEQAKTLDHALRMATFTTFIYVANKNVALRGIFSLFAFIDSHWVAIKNKKKIKAEFVNAYSDSIYQHGQTDRAIHA